MKKWLIAITASLILTSYAAVAKEYVIDDYSFTWTAGDAGDVSLLIESSK